MKKIIVLAFPGNNCEIETARALKTAGFDAEIVRWNADPQKIETADGVILPGGFSFEDRGRAGVIAAKSEISGLLKKMATAGKPILGICNGAQILVEMGLVPGFHSGKVEMALARNRREKNGKILGTGFFHDFIFLKKAENSAFSYFEKILKMPIAHGEGRFLATPEIADAIDKNGQIVMKYVDENGAENPDFPVNPNGSFLNAAAISNPAGNVVAMMPHPERVTGGAAIWASLRDFFDGKIPKKVPKKIPKTSPAVEISPKKSFEIEIFVRLKITDTAEISMESAAQNLLKNQKIKLTRRIFWGIKTLENPHKIAEKLIASDEFLNEAKESAFLKIGDEFFAVKNKKLEKRETFSPVFGFFSAEKDDLLGAEKSEMLKKHAGISVAISSGIFWEISPKISLEKIAATNLFANPVSGKLFTEK